MRMEEKRKLIPGTAIYNRALDAYLRGDSLPVIKERFGVSGQTIAVIARREGWPIRPARDAEIDEWRATVRQIREQNRVRRSETAVAA